MISRARARVALSTKFNSRIYVAANPDVSKAGVPPFFHYLRFGKAEGRVASAAAAIARSGLFDADYYLSTNVDVAAAAWDPFQHYLKYGRFEGRAPSMEFDPNYYLQQNLDALDSELDPVLHYVLIGQPSGRRGRRPGAVEQTEKICELLEQSGLFDADYYLAANPDVAGAGVDPLKHFLYRGRYENRSPSAAFDARFYLSKDPELARTGLPAIDHYLQHGRKAACLPVEPRKLIAESGLFDPEFYRATNLDVAVSGLDPFEHYVRWGRNEGRAPSANFDPSYYLVQNRDLPLKKEEAVLHYILTGRDEQRPARPVASTSENLASARAVIERARAFDAAFYLRQNPPVRDAGIDPLSHYLFSGARTYLDPSSEFSTALYFVEHPAIERSGHNPLAHMLQCAVVNESKCLPNPEDAVRLELMRGEAFFTRFGFSFDPRASFRPYELEAVADLAQRSPHLCIGEAPNPDVSIIIPVYGELQFVLGCLDSISLHKSRFSAEILVIDDCSPEETNTQSVQTIPWIRYVRRESNSGFLDACNYGASIARGKLFVLLNSDTRLVEGWLDELAGAFDLFPNAGLVGSKLINDDGTLQESGGSLSREGIASNYGRGNDPNHPKYCFARQVDYVSGASIAIRADIWTRINGFDREYCPAYCEDSDLAFRIREAGYEVWVQPLSQAIHYEGKTHGRDLTKGGKAYQRTNSIRLANRWKHRLASHLRHGDDPDRAANREARDRVLFIDAVPPRPDHDAGSIFTFKILKAFCELGYQVTFVPQENYAYDGAYTHALERLGIECLYRPYFENIQQVLEYRSDFDVVFACRVNVLGGIFDDLRNRLPEARIIFENADLHYLREDREAALSGSRRKKIRAARTKAVELQLMTKVDCCVVHTPVETQIIKREIGINDIVEIPAVYDLVPTHVPFENRHDLMFLGGFSHTPNGDAVLCFVAKVWPLLLSHLPQTARFVIVGSHPPPEIQALAGRRIVVTGFVEDLQPYFDSSRVFVAPLRYGAGIKGKVIQSLCHGTPSVITSMAAEGVGLVSGRETIIADEDTDFVNGVLSAYFDRTLWYAIQAAGYQFVQSNYSWARCLELIKTALDVADHTWLKRHDRLLRRRLEHLTRDSKEPFGPAQFSSRAGLSNTATAGK